MGSFNVACGISGASINDGERTGMVPIIPQKFKYMSKWFFGGCDRYIPVSPPIYGEYNDYGNLTNIEPSPVVEYLEQAYGMPIETLLECMQVDEPFDRKIVEYFYGEDSILETNPYSKLNTATLSQLGFTKVDEEEAAIEIWEFDSYVMVEGDNESSGPFKTYVVSSIDQDSFGAVKDKAITFSKVSDFVEVFHKATNRWVGLSKKDSDKFNNVRELVWMPFVPEMFDNIVEDGHVMNVYGNSFDRLVEELPEAFERAANTRSGIAMPVEFGLRDNAREVVSIEDLGYKHLLDNPESWRSIFQFADVMRSANKAYMPIVSGEQCGNQRVEKIIAETLLKRYESFLEEVGDYYADEQYDDEEEG